MLRSRPVEKLILHTSFIATGNRAGGGGGVLFVGRERFYCNQVSFASSLFRTWISLFTMCESLSGKGGGAPISPV